MTNLADTISADSKDSSEASAASASAGTSTEATPEVSQDSSGSELASEGSGASQGQSVDDGGPRSAVSEEQTDPTTTPEPAPAKVEVEAARTKNDPAPAESKAEASPAEADAATPASPSEIAAVSQSDSPSTKPSGVEGEAPTPTPAQPAEPEPMKPEILPLVAAMESKEAIRGTVIGWNKGGFHINLNGVTAFCPKSQIERGNPKKASNYLNRELDFRVIEIKENGKRVVVSRSELLAEQREKTLAELREKMKSGTPIKGRVTSITDFGAFVDVGGIEGLIHLSALSRRRVEDPREVLTSGEEVEVKVTKIEKGGERISLSRKALEPDPWKGAEERFEVGEKYRGKILRKADFGFFVELEPGLEGLVHTSQLPHGVSPDDPSVAVDSEIDVWVRDADSGRRRLALSMREVAKGNFKDLISKYEEGQEIDGIVEQVARFGLFVQLEPGLTGLMPFSAMPGQGSGPVGQRTHRPGQEMKVLISEIDSKRKRISLAPVGSQLAGTKSDLRDYKQKQDKSEGGMGAMAAAFAKLQKNG